MNFGGPVSSKVGAVALLVALTIAEKTGDTGPLPEGFSSTLPPSQPTPIEEFFSHTSAAGFSLVNKENIAYTTLQVEPYEVPPGILTNPLFIEAKHNLIKAFQGKISHSSSALEKVTLAYNMVTDWFSSLKNHPNHELQQYAGSFANPLLHAMLAVESSPEVRSDLVSCVFHSRVTHYWVRVKLSDADGKYTVFDLDPTEYDSPTMLFPRGIPELGPFGEQPTNPNN